MNANFFDVDNGLMKWDLTSVEKETEHPFLNFYTLHYDVEKGDMKKEHRYFLASRKEKDTLRPITKEYKRPDGVVVALYRFNENNDVEILLTKQFRPAIGNYVFSLPAGLLDENEDLLEAAKREAKEEVGAEDIHDVEILTPLSPTSSGMSDEANAFIMARVDKQENSNLEEFEDISSCFVPIEKCLELFKDERYIFPLHARIWILYMAERFKK